MLGALLGGGGASLQTSTTQTNENKTTLTQGPVTFGAKIVGNGGGMAALYVVAGLVALVALIFAFRK